MKREIATFVSRCMTCQLVKADDRSPKCKAAIVVITGETGSIHGEFSYRETCPNKKKTNSSLKKTIQIKFSN